MARQSITSRTNARVRDAVRLRDRRHRVAQQRFLVEGKRELARAISAGIEFLHVFVSHPGTDPELVQLEQRLQEQGATLFEVTPNVMRKLAFGQRDEGLVGIAQTPTVSLEQLPVRPTSLVAVLDGVEKPGNLGAVLRTAEASGVGALVVVGGGTDLYNPAVVRASLGSVFTLPCCATDAGTTLAWLRKRGKPTYVAEVDAAAKRYDQIDYRQGANLVLGSEAQGVGSVWQAEDVATIYIPMQGAVDSLNVSAAATVLFYEAARQRDN